MDGTQFLPTYSPDGLHGRELDELIERAYAEAAVAARASSVLVGGAAAERRRRRLVRRSAAAVVRALPVAVRRVGEGEAA